MSKRKSKIEKWIQAGRDSGIGVAYKSWLKIQEVSSKGRSTYFVSLLIALMHQNIVMLL